MVVWWRILQFLIVVGIIAGVAGILVLMYGIPNTWLGMAALVISSFIFALMVAWVASLDNNIRKRKGE